MEEGCTITVWVRERVLLRKLSRKNNLHISVKPEQRLSPCHLLLRGQTHNPAQLALWALRSTHSSVVTMGCSHPQAMWAPPQGCALRSFQPLLSSVTSLKLSIRPGTVTGDVWSPELSPFPQPDWSWQLGGSKCEQGWAAPAHTPLLWLESAWMSLTKWKSSSLYSNEDEVAA